MKRFKIMKVSCISCPVLLLLLAFSCKGPVEQDANLEYYPHYDMAVHIVPATGHIDVKGKLHVPEKSLSHQEIIFYLDSGLQTESFYLNKMVAFKMDTLKAGLSYMPSAAKIFPLEPLKLKDGPNEFSFSYGGFLSELPSYFANKLDPTWVEMGLYYPWFPFSERIGLYTYRLEITIEPAYSVFGLGQASKKDSTTILESTIPTNDMVICASKDVNTKHWQAGKNKLNLYYHKLNDSIVSKIQTDLSAVITSLSGYFGDEARTLNIILSKREKGGGYGRIGGMFLGGFNPDRFYEYNEAYHRYFAHEFSHLWWHKADPKSWEDWLNEGFAEYTALMVLRDIFGVEVFSKRIQGKTDAIADTPPIWGFARSDMSSDKNVRNAELILYSKAPVLLFKLEERIGKENFLTFTNDLIAGQVSNTEQFLETLTTEQGEETSTWFMELLKTF